MMGAIRLNISLPEDTFHLLKEVIEPRKRSQFISEAILQLIRRRKAKKLAEEYREAAAEIKRVNRELEGTLSDGLD